MKFDIFNRFTGAVQFTADIDCADDTDDGVKIGLAVKLALKSNADLAHANLARANLIGADLAHANLIGANLIDADLAHANLIGAKLARADLAHADLAHADLAHADLAHANLIGANLAHANLAHANLIDADLARADIVHADLAHADLAHANLIDANLAHANLARANLIGQELTIARTRILPDGDIIGWKQCRSRVIVKMLIPAGAKRSHAFGRKCRAEYADVLEVIGAEVGIAKHDKKTEYRVGQRVIPDSFDDNWKEECSHGVHFFITRIEAENY